MDGTVEPRGAHPALEPATVTTFSWIFVGTGPTFLAVGELGVHHPKMDGLIQGIRSSIQAHPPSTEDEDQAWPFRN